jgi:hypothetical protein
VIRPYSAACEDGRGSSSTQAMQPTMLKHSILHPIVSRQTMHTNILFSLTRLPTTQLGKQSSGWYIKLQWIRLHEPQHNSYNIIRFYIAYAWRTEKAIRGHTTSRTKNDLDQTLCGERSPPAPLALGAETAQCRYVRR